MVTRRCLARPCLDIRYCCTGHAQDVGRQLPSTGAFAALARQLFQIRYHVIAKFDFARLHGGKVRKTV